MSEVTKDAKTLRSLGENLMREDVSAQGLSSLVCL
jgi:hypothetical protein